jgi:formyl-CoA transferase
VTVLNGIKVVELGTMITAPLCAMMLGDLGAEVVKVENPQGGDPFRSFRGGIYSPNFVAYNRGKRSVALDLRTEPGRAVLLDLLGRADVLIENFRAGVMERMGLGADAVRAANPRLIHCSITGFGADGPYSARPAYDMVGVALSGIGSLMLDPQAPQALGPTIPDNATGMYACYGVLGALFDRERTGRGHRLEVNMLESAISFIPDPMANYTRVGTRSGPLTRVAASQSYALRCRDGKLIALHLSSQATFWEGLVKALEHPELAHDPRFVTRELRIANYLELSDVLAGIIAGKTRAQWIGILEAADVPFAPVHELADVLVDGQVQHLHTFYKLHHPTEGEVIAAHRPVLIDGAREQSKLPPPTHGEHTEAVLAELGYDAAAVGRLRAAGAI